MKLAAFTPILFLAASVAHAGPVQTNQNQVQTINNLDAATANLIQSINRAAIDASDDPTKILSIVSDLITGIVSPLGAISDAVVDAGKAVLGVVTSILDALKTPAP
ncbi:hypothetical protein BX661DRAFT_174987 [Kickxella alabastrina]|uniref:uncharacterized protein n=1 Tax=Kickxella alabastrina TaxID=61397 RepID=UPI0022200435|nr:uncharacterized protein BX661DRAFT_174987 [Kickxella alabastrina]KAI7834520.1 hypothetical protein BX661DRAFT_174987 [Kickxella alabastrina]KAJ1937831.1 hypothetical protein GGF37_005047 [Kickxella alabastrina]